MLLSLNCKQFFTFDHYSRTHKAIAADCSVKWIAHVMRPYSMYSMVFVHVHTSRHKISIYTCRNAAHINLRSGSVNLCLCSRIHICCCCFCLLWIQSQWHIGLDWIGFIIFLVCRFMHNIGQFLKKKTDFFILFIS